MRKNVRAREVKPCIRKKIWPVFKHPQYKKVGNKEFTAWRHQNKIFKPFLLLLFRLSTDYYLNKYPRIFPATSSLGIDKENLQVTLMFNRESKMKFCMNCIRKPRHFLIKWNQNSLVVKHVEVHKLKKQWILTSYLQIIAKSEGLTFFFCHNRT